MRLNVNDMLYAFSYALDCVEHDVVGVTTNHGKRVAFLAVLMGKKLGISEEGLMDLAGLSVLHDNALIEYKKAEIDGADSLIPAHCIAGERNIGYMYFWTDVKNAVLYHHENADGSGAFGKRAEETPLYAQLIHMADQVDAKWNLSTVTEGKFHEVLYWVRQKTGTLFSAECTEAFEESITFDLLKKTQMKQIDGLLYEVLPGKTEDYSNEQIKNISALFARIVDYKSEFTSRHSIGIAEKAERMALYYGWSEDKAAMLYFAGALHDIGKLAVDRDILEKPARLSDEEYKHIQNHAYATYEILSRIKGMEEITKWAAYHHERLDGKGYPFGKTAEELGEEERLLACLDIYQALTEDRPYKAGFSHGKTIGILREMAEDQLIDMRIVEDIHEVFRKDIEINDV